MEKADSNKMTRRNIDIPDDLWHWVSVEAAKQGKSKRQLVVEALEFLKQVNDFGNAVTGDGSIDSAAYLLGVKRRENETDKELVSRMKKVEKSIRGKATLSEEWEKFI